MLSPETPKFHSKRLVYRAATACIEHVNLLVRIYSDPVNLMLANSMPAKPFRREDGEEWIKMHEKKLVSWIFHIPKGGEPSDSLATEELLPIGWIYLNENNASRSGLLGIFMLTEYQSKGYGTEAVEHVLRFAFVSANLRRLELMCYEFNKGGLRAYEKCGFVREGTRREALWCQGKYWDIYLMAMLRKEWLEQQGLSVQVD